MANSFCPGTVAVERLALYANRLYLCRHSCVTQCLYDSAGCLRLAGHALSFRRFRVPSA